MSVHALPRRRCMVCRRDKLIGHYNRQTDPICADCTDDVREQRSLLRKKYKSAEHDAIRREE